MTPEDHSRILEAIRSWITAKESQGQRSAEGGKAQGGTRSQVTGGKHLDGINRLIADEIHATGVTNVDLRENSKATLAGWYRPSKAWDLLVVQQGKPVLVVEYKSMAGSEGKNLNNRFDEVIGIAEDARQATLRGILPESLRRAYVFILEITPTVQRANKPRSAVGNPDIMFDGTNYFDRLAILCERMRDAGLYHLVWVLGVHRDPLGFCEPEFADVGWDRFASDLRAGFVPGEAI